ncbi:MAG: S1 RNA-binding domain-containing protein, partial [Candidatus Zipacnadales bacterium]
VPITAPVAGVSVGVVYENEQKYALLVDLQGAEDQLGSDMDFKVAGTREGVNAIHLDMKIQGLPSHILSEALALAREARLQILDLMTEVIPYPRAELSRYAPRIFSMEIDKDKIGLLIGPGGKMIRKIEDDYGVEIDIQDDGVVFIAATDSDSATGAREFIHSLTRDIQVGEEFTAKITKTTPFGAFAELMPGKEGLIHISELAWEHVRATEDIVKVGDQVRVRVIEVDDDGKIRLSRKVLLERRSPTRSTQGGGHPRADRPLSREQQTASPHRSNAFDRRSDSRRGFSRPRGERTSDEKLDRPGLGSNAYLREPRKR